MSRLVLTVVLCSALASSAEPAAEPSNAVTLRLGGGAAVVPALGGLGVLASSSPEGGLSYERAFGRLSAVLALDASASFGPGGESIAASVEPGLRWTFGEHRLSGPWLGVAVPLSLRRTSALVGGLDALGSGAGATRFTSTSLGFGFDALAGWSFRFDNGFFAQVAAGPRVNTTRFSSMPDTVQLTPSATVGLRAFASLGAAF